MANLKFAKNAKTYKSGTHIVAIFTNSILRPFLYLQFAPELIFWCNIQLVNFTPSDYFSSKFRLDNMVKVGHIAWVITRIVTLFYLAFILLT